MRDPAKCASTLRRESGAGIAAPPGRVMPRASTIQAIVDAVPMVMQCPSERVMPSSASPNSSRVILPARRSSLNFHTSVPEPISRPRYLPLSMGPPGTTRVGKSTLAAPIKHAGVVLSHPVSSTTPSTGLARMHSSTSMLAKLRKSMVVGRMMGSPSEVTGNSTGTPPASYTPRLTASAKSRK